MLSIKKTLGLAAAAVALVAGSLAGAAPAQAVANGLTMTGPSSGTPGQQVQYQVTGTPQAIQVGSVVLLDQNGTQWAAVPFGVGAPNTVTLSFQIPSSG